MKTMRNTNNNDNNYKHKQNKKSMNMIIKFDYDALTYCDTCQLRL